MIRVLRTRGLEPLRSLHNLRLLNLVGTAVTAKGILSLEPLKQLESIYLYRTKCASTDWPMLKQHFPKTALDTGGYTVPFVARDTVNELKWKKK